MQQIKWFERKFDFSEQNIFPAIVERLVGTPLRIQHKVAGIAEEQLNLRSNDSWSIKEHIGHLIDLEPLWQGRLEDALNGEKYLREADLTNRRTHEANHNAKAIGELLQEMNSVRSTTIGRLRQLREEDIFSSALHPRLEQPMRIMDLFLFVAEHDDHHLAGMEGMLRR